MNLTNISTEITAIAQWLKENGNPHDTVIISDSYAKIVRDEQGYPITQA